MQPRVFSFVMEESNSGVVRTVSRFSVLWPVTCGVPDISRFVRRGRYPCSLRPGGFQLAETLLQHLNLIFGSLPSSGRVIYRRSGSVKGYVAMALQNPRRRTAYPDGYVVVLAVVRISARVQTTLYSGVGAACVRPLNYNVRSKGLYTGDFYNSCLCGKWILVFTYFYSREDNLLSTRLLEVNIYHMQGLSISKSIFFLLRGSKEREEEIEGNTFSHFLILKTYNSNFETDL